jgi:hypothetical protein
MFYAWLSSAAVKQMYGTHGEGAENEQHTILMFL